MDANRAHRPAFLGLSPGPAPGAAQHRELFRRFGALVQAMESGDWHDVHVLFAPEHIAAVDQALARHLCNI